MMASPSAIVSFIAGPGQSSAQRPSLLIAGDGVEPHPIALGASARRHLRALAIPSGLASGEGARPATRAGPELETAIRAGLTVWTAADLGLQVGKSASTISRAEDQLEAALASADLDPRQLLSRSRDAYALDGVLVDALAVLQAALIEDWAAISALLRTLGVSADRATLTASEHWSPLAREAVHEALLDTLAWERDHQAADASVATQRPLAPADARAPTESPADERSAESPPPHLADTAAPLPVTVPGAPKRPRIGAQRLAMVAATAVILALAGFAVWRALDAPETPPVGEVTLVVDNRVTAGAVMREDRQPVSLTSRAIAYCGRAGCVLPDTERHSGQSYRPATCQLSGERVTNGNDGDPADDANPGRFESRRYYGVRLSDGVLGYVSEVWIRARDRGGLGLPRCDAAPRPR
jgi:hypothetical protein